MQDVRGRSQILLDEWFEDISHGWFNATDGLPASIHYVHWLEEKLSKRTTMQQVPTTTIPTELHMALVELLDVIPPILEDWIQMTGFGEIHRRDMAALDKVKRATKLHQEWTGVGC